MFKDLKINIKKNERQEARALTLNATYDAYGTNTPVVRVCRHLDAHFLPETALKAVIVIIMLGSTGNVGSAKYFFVGKCLKKTTEYFLKFLFFF